MYTYGLNFLIRGIVASSFLSLFFVRILLLYFFPFLLFSAAAVTAVSLLSSLFPPPPSLSPPSFPPPAAFAAAAALTPRKEEIQAAFAAPLSSPFLFKCSLPKISMQEYETEEIRNFKMSLSWIFSEAWENGGKGCLLKIIWETAKRPLSPFPPPPPSCSRRRPFKFSSHEKLLHRPLRHRPSVDPGLRGGSCGKKEEGSYMLPPPPPVCR